MVLLGIDPGLTTGVARLVDGKVRGAWECHLNDLPFFLRGLESPDVVVAESFALFPGKAKALIGSSMPAAQAKGIVAAWALERGVKLVEVPPASKKTVAEHVLRIADPDGLLTGKRHARDAARVCLVHVLSSGRLSRIGVGATGQIR